MTKNSNIRVCIVMPAYNESAVIGNVVSSAVQDFADSPYLIDLVVVDDGSKDDTANIAKQNGAVVIQHVINIGAGGATATGLSYAQQQGFDIACTMDADGQHSSEDVVEGIDQLISQQADLLIGSRLIDDEGMSKIKILGNKGLSIITYLLFGTNTTDSQSGLRIFSRKAIEQLKWKTSGYEFCSEMLWRAKQEKLIIGEYPIKAIYTDYSKAKGQNNWNAINIVKSLIKRRITEMFE